MANTIISADFSKFGFREMKEGIELLEMYRDNKYHTNVLNYWYDDKITVNFNNQSGWVFLSNSDYQCLVEHNGKLDLWLSCPNCCHEDYLNDYDKLLNDCCKNYWEQYQ